MKRRTLPLIAAITLAVAAGTLFAARYLQRERGQKLRFERGETELVVANLIGVPAHLFRAGKRLDDAAEVSPFNGRRLWLSRGDYFLKVDLQGGAAFYPININSYRNGPDEDGSLAVTIRHSPSVPPRPPGASREFQYIPSGNFLFGDRLNPREPHYVWLPAFFISPFETTNAEFAEFLRNGYNDDSNWTDAGKAWKSANSMKNTATLNPSDPEFKRFGQPDQPVTRVTWFEANGYCRWLTRKFGGGRWLFSLPSEAEWEKAARGPDGFDYALSRTLSDDEVKLYNWKKNPDAAVTVVGIGDSLNSYAPNRYGLYHISGNVAEWTSSIAKPFNRERPYLDEERNRDDASDARVVRGGSWYSASIALLYIPYRDSFVPELSNHDLGFRIVARPLP